MCQETFAEEIGHFQSTLIVDELWEKLNIDDILDRQIDEAIEKVRNEETFLQIVKSGWSSEKAGELASRTANYAMNSEEFKKAMEELSNLTAIEFSNALETVTARSASTAMACLQEFIGSTYPTVVISVFENEIRTSTGTIDFTETYQGDIGAFLSMHGKAITGFSVIIAAYIARKVVQKIAVRIGRRVAGRIASRVAGRIATTYIPFVGWFIGGLMIAWDVYDSREGALPHIREYLKDEEIKKHIKTDIAETMMTELAAETPKIARVLSGEIYGYWVDFKDKFRKVLELTRENPEFRIIVDNTSPEDFYKLSKLVDISIYAVGIDGFDRAIRDGSFKKVLSYPETSFDIIETTGSFQTAIDWVELAGVVGIDNVVRFEIYKDKTPADFDKRLLERLLDVNDYRTISKLTMLDNDQMQAMLKISRSNLQNIAHHFDVAEMSQLAWYFNHLEPDANRLIVSYVANQPGSFYKLTPEPIKKDIAGSKNPGKTIRFYLSPAGYQHLIADAYKVLSGDIPKDTYINKYGARKIFVFFIGLSVGSLGMIIGLLFYMRRKMQPIRRKKLPKRIPQSDVSHVDQS